MCIPLYPHSTNYMLENKKVGSILKKGHFTSFTVHPVCRVWHFYAQLSQCYLYTEAATIDGSQISDRSRAENDTSFSSVNDTLFFRFPTVAVQRITFFLSSAKDIFFSRSDVGQLTRVTVVQRMPRLTLHHPS